MPDIIHRFDGHCHTMYSNTKFVDSINKPKELIDRAIELGLKGIAITDHSGLGAHVVANQYAQQIQENHPDFKVALGEEGYLCRTREKGNYYFHQIWIAKDKIGHKMIREMSSTSWIKGYYDRGIFRTPILWDEVQETVEKYGRGHIIASSACFRAGTTVLSENGYIPIEDVRVGTKLVNRYGQLEETIIPTVIDYRGDGYDIKTYGNSDMPSMVCSSDHKFLAIKGDPFPYCNKNHTKIPKKWLTAEELFERKEKGLATFLLYPIKDIKYNSEKRYLKKSEWASIDNSTGVKCKIGDIEITPYLMRLFGLFLGDGSIDVKNKRICFSFNKEEFPFYWKDFVEPVEKKYNIHFSISHRENQNKVDVVCGSVDFFKIFLYLFGNVKGHTKSVPDRIKHISREFDMELIFGYELADGYFQKTLGFKKDKEHTSGRMVSTSISKKLTFDFLDLLESLHINCSVWKMNSHTGKDGVFHQDSWYLQVTNPKFGETWVKKTNNSHEQVIEIFEQLIKDKSSRFSYDPSEKCWYKKVPIKSITKVELNEPLYCLMNNSHSFVCEGVIVHNCLAGTANHNLQLMIEAEQAGDTVARKKHHKEIVEYVRFMKDLFGDDFYLEVAPGRSDEQIAVNSRMPSLAKAFGVKMVCFSDAHYLKKEDAQAHSIFLNAKSSSDRETSVFYSFAYLQSQDEVIENLAGTGLDFEELCANSMEIYDKIENYSLFHTQQVPQIPVKDYPKRKVESKYQTLDYLYNSDNPQERYWVNRCIDTLKEKELLNDEYLSELEYEADIQKFIGEKLDTCIFSYSNLMEYIINVAWSVGSCVGVSRGSGGAGLNHYLLGVTQEDPIKSNLKYYWRFLNKERVELPDIDFDMSPDKKQEFYAKVRQDKGGELGLVQVCTYGTLGSKNAILTAARGMGIDNDKSQFLSNLVGQERGFTYSLSDMINGNKEKGLDPNKQFLIEMGKYPGLLDTAVKIEGVIDHIGIHASGCVLEEIDDPYKYSAFMRVPSGVLVTQFDLHCDEYLGETKIDALYTDEMTIIGQCIQLLQEHGYMDKKLSLREAYNKYIHPDVLPLEDDKLWDAIDKANILALFQLNTMVGSQTVKLLQPRNVTELIACNSLMRLMPEKGQETPSERFARVKNHPEQWDREMDEWGLTQKEKEVMHRHFSESAGCCPSQEQVMLVAMDEDVCGYSLAESNALRKTIAKCYWRFR